MIRTWLGILPLVILTAIYTAGAWAAAELHIPKPTDSLKPAPPPPALETSVVNLEIRLPAEELATAVDQGFPQVAAREDDWKDAATLGDREDVRFLYRIVRGSFRYRMERDHFEVWLDQVRYRVWARKDGGEGFVEGRCGHGNDPPKRLNLAARSALTWSDRWRLQSHTTFDEPVFLEPCLLSGLDLDATSLLKGILQTRLEAVGQSIDRIIRERTEARKRAETIWQQLQEPVEFASNQWLAFNPREARVSPIISNGTLVVQTSVNLVMEPRIISGSKPVKAALPLPSLQLAPVPMEGFHLALPVTVDYGQINRRLEQEMIGQEFQAPIGDSVRIDGVQLYGSGDKLILALRVSGGVNGNLYATGTPVFDQGLGILRFADLDFTMDTRNVLLRSANWMFHQNILSTLRSEAIIDLSGQLQSLRSRLGTALSRDLGGGATLQGEVLSLRPRGVYPTTGGVEVHIIADGAMWVELR
ncbi:MAG TPA: DUF4403 family protein [Nitrospira sp.]|nr:DUF4403 family protein [Nitrospira sp.]